MLPLVRGKGLGVGVLTLLWFSAPAPALRGGEMVLTNGLAISGVGQWGRRVVHTDAIEAQIVAGSWHAPFSGEWVAGVGGRAVQWKPIQAGTNGAFNLRGTRGGYVFLTATSARARVALLEASGHNLAYVNGEPAAGDPYAYGYVHLPVWLRAGTNEFLFQVSRGGLRVRLAEPTAPVMLNLGDNTLPDLVVGDREPVWGAVVVLNTSTEPVHDVALEVCTPTGHRRGSFPVDLLPLGVRKVGFLIGPAPGPATGKFAFKLRLVRAGRGGRGVLDQAALSAEVRLPTQLLKRTFRSDIDGSVQYYAVNPPPTTVAHPALFLSLHGASVEAAGQAAAYAPKRWGVIVCPTNRRPYGFDWEEWGRMDALEVLADAERRYRPDLSRVYLTGHSMGGHGTWQLGATFPGLFAAIGPSAGWISFASYTEPPPGEPASAKGGLLARASASSDTLAMVTNYLHEAIYILHGNADDNVPVAEARAMRDQLARFHHDFEYYEQPGAGHWWDVSDEPGADCVDWAPMFDLFAHHRVPAAGETRRVQFTTVNPGVSSRCAWLCLEAQTRPLLPSAVDVRCDPGRRRFVAQTENVARLSLELLPLLTPNAPVTVELDGQRLGPVGWPGGGRAAAGVPRLVVERSAGQWGWAGAPAPGDKGPSRYGPLKEAFKNRMVFVYGTAGTPAENAWALAKARFDAETFWYRGNGSVDVTADSAYLAARRAVGRATPPARQAESSAAAAALSPELAGVGGAIERLNAPRGRRAGRVRNVILYGNAANNAAWAVLLGNSPVQVGRGWVQLGARRLVGEDAACLFLRPHPDDPTALVAVVSGSGLAGMRLAERLPLFLSGAGFPDCLVIGPEMLAKGTEGVRAVGFFGRDWSVERGEFAW